MEGFAFGLRASNGSIDTSESDQWSASERALRVSQNDALHAKLNDEIHRSGFLTSAGHRAIVPQFLHSDAVDEEMAKVRDAKPQEGLFRRLISSGSATSSMTSSTGSVSSSREGRRSARRRSSGSLASSLCRSFTDLFLETDFDPCELNDGDDANDVGRNIAPRRASIDREMSDVLSQLYRVSGDEIRRRPCTDDKGEAPESSRPDDNTRRSQDASYDYVDACADNILSSLRRSYGSADTLLEPCERIEDDDDSCMDECGWLPWPERIEGDDDSCTDECGFLPWPER